MANRLIVTTPVNFCTAAYYDEVRALAGDCGVQHILTKPSEPQIILHTVKEALGRSTAEFISQSVEEFDPEHLRPPGLNCCRHACRPISTNVMPDLIVLMNYPSVPAYAALQARAAIEGLISSADSMTGRLAWCEGLGAEIYNGYHIGR